eukprot:GILI01002448.1.p1 GENE.GILI01002448.1~~GILI01002448.1.p1  ORF type:complete len:735 (+),score=195.81 GILI01002448.1:139-2343(+)
MTDKKGKFVIRPFRMNQPMDEAQAHNTWKLLEKAIQEIYSHNSGTLSFEELYRNAYNLVLHKHGDLLYQGVSESVRKQLLAAAEKVVTTTDDLLLKELQDQWQNHKVIMGIIRDILMYMDRMYVPQAKKHLVYDMGLILFREHIAKYERLRSRLLRVLLTLIRKDRVGDVIEKQLIKSATSMLVDLGVHSKAVYEEEFERHFLQETATFYQQEAQDYIAQNTTPEYLKKAEARLREEHQRVQNYLDSSTESKLKDVVEKELITTYAKTLVENESSGCISMFKDKKTEDLARMFSLFSRVPSTLEDVKAALSKHVRDQGLSIVNDQEKLKEPVSYIQSLLDLKDAVDSIVRDAFRNDKAFQKVVKDSFEHFCNLDTRPAQFLSLYLDDLLKKGTRGSGSGTEADMERLLDKCIVLFRFIADKDVFENFYKQHLAKRLLSSRSESDDLERSMISKLKTECGYQFTQKLEGMFNDMKMSTDINTQFRQDKGRTINGLEMFVSVLTTGSWPTQPTPPCEVPLDLKPCVDSFTEYYLSKHSGRRLTFQYNMGNADLKAMLGGTSRYELNVSTYQMLALLLFNSSSSLVFKDMASALSVPTSELRRHVLSLTTPKCQILTKEPKGKDVADNDVLTVNIAFTSKLLRVKVPLVTLKENIASADVPEPVEEDRKHLIEAAIVRIMKSRRTLEHNLLVAEVTKQLSSRFMPSPNDIKKRIESLIERDYLERSKQDRRMYNYLA